MTTIHEDRLHDEDEADTVLLIGKNRVRIKVNRKLLEVHSPVLKTRLASGGDGSCKTGNCHGDQDDEGLEVFEFEDFEVVPFQNFIEYASTPESWRWSAEDPVKDLPGLLDFWRLAKKLQVVDLTQNLEQILHNFVTSSSSHDGSNQEVHALICQIFHWAKKFGVSPLKDETLRKILASALEIFENLQNYLILSSEDMTEILISDDLEVQCESQLFDIILRWGRVKCKDLEGADEMDNLRKILTDLLPLLRWNEISLEEFMEFIFPTGILTEEQLADIFPIFYWKSSETKQPQNFLQPQSNKTKQTNTLIHTNFSGGRRKYRKNIWSIPEAILSKKILSFLPTTDLYASRFVSKSFRRIIDQNLIPLKVTLDENNLEKMSNLYGGGHEFRKIIFKTKIFTPNQRDQLTKFLSNSNINVGAGGCCDDHGIILDMDLASVGQYWTLTSFLTQTHNLGVAGNLRVNLKIGQILQTSTKISRPLPIVGNSKFPQLSSLTVTNLVDNETAVQCLIDLVRSGPNLKEISLGDLSSRLTWSALKSCGLVRFFMTAGLKNVAISCSLFYLDSPVMSPKFFAELKERNVTFKKINLNYCPCPKGLPFLNIFHEHLEQTLCLSVSPKESLGVAPRFWPNLKILQIECKSINWVFGALGKAPNLEKLVWSTAGHFEQHFHNKWTLGQLQLPKLDMVVLDLCPSLGQQTLQLLSSFCPNVTRFRCQNVDVLSIVWLYQFFPGLKELQFSSACLQNCELMDEVMTGWSKKGGKKADLQNSDSSSTTQDGQQRQTFIGHLKQLRTLHLGLLDYQPSLLHWLPQSEVFSHGICHLALLEEIIFFPMTRKDGENLVNFLVTMETSAKLKLVHFQVQIVTSSSLATVMMTNEDVKELELSLAPPFQLKPMMVLPYDGIHCSLYY